MPAKNFLRFIIVQVLSSGFSNLKVELNTSHFPNTLRSVAHAGARAIIALSSLLLV
jgi:hypothetical protein